MPIRITVATTIAMIRIVFIPVAFTTVVRMAIVIFIFPVSLRPDHSQVLGNRFS
jgi:hypothetical protein